ncbi:MAG: NADH-quinone oxidoreductase subunit A [Nitrososphaerota archaeon]
MVNSRLVHNGSGIIKLMPYSCGENFPFDVRSRIDLERFMIYAIYFLVLDVAAFILAISFNLLSLAVITYSALILASISLMVKR